jgi:hypothetical protein
MEKATVPVDWTSAELDPNNGTLSGCFGPEALYPEPVNIILAKIFFDMFVVPNLGGLIARVVDRYNTAPPTIMLGIGTIATKVYCELQNVSPDKVKAAIGTAARQLALAGVDLSPWIELMKEAQTFTVELDEIKQMLSQGGKPTE